MSGFLPGFIPLHRKISWWEKAGYLKTSRDFNHLQLGYPGKSWEKAHHRRDKLNQLPELPDCERKPWRISMRFRQ